MLLGEFVAIGTAMRILQLNMEGLFCNQAPSLSQYSRESERVCMV